MEVTHNHNAKSQLAKLLASENITVQHSASAKTAWFDVKNRILMLPLWREMTNDLYDMLVVHEVGHALDTPAEGWVEEIKNIANRVHGSKVSQRAIAAVKGYLNVIEDARIDKRQKRRFPGARRNYVKGYAELIERDFFGTATKDVNSMIFIDRLNIYFKGGAMLGIKFSSEEKKWVNAVAEAETFDEVIKLTEEIYAFTKEQIENHVPETQEDDLEFGDEEGDEYGEGASDFGDEDDSDDFDDYEDGDGDSDEEGDEDGEGSGDAEDDEDASESNAKNGSGRIDKSADEKKDETPASSSTTSDGAGETDQDVVPESLTEKTWTEKSETLVMSSDIEYVYAKLPRIANYDSLVHDYKRVLKEQRADITRRYDADWISLVREKMNRFRSDENSIISYMVNEFEMRKAADEYLRTSVSKTGVIDTNKLHSYKYNDDLFRRITTVASGKNHGFVMFLDWSGSMDSHLRKTMKQLFSLVMFCKRVQIPFDVYLFRTRSGLDGEGIANGHELYTKRPGDIVLSPFTARNILSSRMNVAELNEAMLYMWIASGDGSMYVDSLGSTPLNPCIAVASEIVDRFKARHKVQVVNVAILTDGDSDPMDATIHGVSSYGQYGSGKRMVIIQDEFTKKTYDLPKSGSYGGISASFRNFTPVLLKILKDRTGANLLGFFIADSFGRNYTRYNGFNRSTDQYKNARKSWSDYGFFGVTTAGYDEYYILDAKKFNVSSGDLKVTSGASKRKMASEFIKHNEKKTNSRILLSQVVKRISS